MTFIAIPDDSGDVRWWVLGLGVAVALIQWYALAQSAAKAAAAEQLNKDLLRVAAESAASGPRIEAQNETTHSLLAGLHQLYQQKNVYGATSGADNTIHLAGTARHLGGSATGTLTVAPGAGELKVEGYAPTVSVKALDQEIRETEAAVVRSLRVRPAIIGLAIDNVSLFSDDQPKPSEQSSEEHPSPESDA